MALLVLDTYERIIRGRVPSKATQAGADDKRGLHPVWQLSFSGSGKNRISSVADLLADVDLAPAHRLANALIHRRTSFS